MSGAALQNVVRNFDRFGNGYASGFLAAVPEPSMLCLSGMATSVAMLFRPRRRAATISKPTPSRS
jgi:hypothetical protein